MKSTNFNLVRYDADEGYVFDWKDPRFIDIFDDEGEFVEQIQEHLYAKTLFIGGNDNIDNYIEVVKPVEEEGEE
jgi:hypothetical protein